MQNLLDQRDSIKKDKDEEIGKLQKSIETMTNNFHGMLKDTLEKMKDKISEANAKWEDDQDEKLKVQANT